MGQQRKAVVLLSGGLDSTTALAIARDEGYEPYAMSFKYGQRHSVELEAAERVAKAQGVVKHVVVPIDLRMFGGSALTDETIAVPHHDSVDDLSQDIPITYVPGRNTIFLAFAQSWAETLEASAVFIGVSGVDYSGYPDCRQEYIDKFQELADIATKAAVEGRQLQIRAPLSKLSKVETIKRGLELGVDYGLTHSCYDPDGAIPCGSCDSCLLRQRAFTELGLTDPALTATGG